MRIYATRRECEIILSCLYDRMSALTLNEMAEYNNIADRIIRVTSHQCEKDRTTYKEKENDHEDHI